MQNEIWLLDYKTDRVGEEDWPAKLAAYRPQLALYAKALARIYARPVTRVCLHFLAVGRTVELPTPG